MSRLVKILCNNKRVIFDTGRFDEWCVFVVEADGHKHAPKDVQYFSDLLTIAARYCPLKVYSDFVTLYELTTKTVQPETLNRIETIAESYNADDKLLIEQWFTVVYAGMIAEENKANTILKKRIKRLGMYQVLVQGMSAPEAAKYSYGRKWQDLDLLMRHYGF